jgi:hypothetical protein
MQINKLALALIVSSLCLGCRIRVGKSQIQHQQAIKSHPILTASLRAALEEVNTMKAKIERDGGVNTKEYSEDLSDLENIMDNAYGDPETSKAVRSVVEGHQLTLQFIQCDRASGYDEMHQCRDKVMKKLFVKYPDFAAQAQAAVEGENLPYISAGLDKDAVVHAIWQQIAKDTEAVYVTVYPELIPSNSISQN